MLHLVRDAPGPGVRSFHPRRGRLGPTGAHALARLLPQLGVAVDGRPVDLPALFGRTAPVVLEIGCGDGAATATMAAADPARDVLAVDVHTPGLAALLRRLDGDRTANVRVAEGDAHVVLSRMLGPGTLDEVRLWFPDPWPKTRHRKRRLVTPAFADLLADRLRPGGRVRVATDDAGYAGQVLDAVRRCPLLHGGTVSRPADRPVTRFERRAITAGRPVVDVAARRA